MIREEQTRRLKNTRQQMMMDRQSRVWARYTRRLRSCLQNWGSLSLSELQALLVKKKMHLHVHYDDFEHWIRCYNRQFPVFAKGACKRAACTSLSYNCDVRTGWCIFLLYADRFSMTKAVKMS